MRTLARIVGVASLLLPSIHAASTPAFSVSPPNLYLAAAVDGASPASQVIVVNNTVANSTLKWRASLTGSGAAYCAVNPRQGNLVGQGAVFVSGLASVPAVSCSFQGAGTLSGNGSPPPAPNSASVN